MQIYAKAWLWYTVAAKGKRLQLFLVLVVQLIIILLIFCVFFTVYAIVLCIYSLIKEWTVRLFLLFTCKSISPFHLFKQNFLAISSSQQELTFLMFKYFRLLPECMHLWLQNDEVFSEERTLWLILEAVSLVLKRITAAILCSAANWWKCLPPIPRDLLMLCVYNG